MVLCIFQLAAMRGFLFGFISNAPHVRGNRGHGLISQTALIQHLSRAEIPGRLFPPASPEKRRPRSRHNYFVFGVGLLDGGSRIPAADNCECVERPHEFGESESAFVKRGRLKNPHRAVPYDCLAVLERRLESLDGL